jgi:anthranilate phosphoribosyltransferase
VLLNAAAALRVARIAEGYQEGLTLARAAVDSGAAAGRLEELLLFSREQMAAAG